MVPSRARGGARARDRPSRIPGTVGRNPERSTQSSRRPLDHRAPAHGGPSHLHSGGRGGHGHRAPRCPGRQDHGPLPHHVGGRRAFRAAHCAAPGGAVQGRPRCRCHFTSLRLHRGDDRGWTRKRNRASGLHSPSGETLFPGRRPPPTFAWLSRLRADRPAVHRPPPGVVPKNLSAALRRDYAGGGLDSTDYPPRGIGPDLWTGAGCGGQCTEPPYRVRPDHFRSHAVLYRAVLSGDRRPGRGFPAPVS
jgi:hypothetical protein